MRPSIRGWFRGDVSADRLGAARARCIEAYDLVERAPRGAERRAAWAAYALVTYGDKLVTAATVDGYVDTGTARTARLSFELAGRCLDPGGGIPPALPRWPGGVRSEPQLRGMRETLDALRTHLAFDLQSRPDEAFAARLAEVDARLKKVDSLLIPRATPELRGGIAGALVAGLDEAYALGLALSG